jgi:hypothetical protein
MERRSLTRANAAIFVLIVMGVIMPLSGQTPVRANNARTDGGSGGRHTPDGQPDLAGLWTNATLTPLERPAALGQKQFYTDEELAALRRQINEQSAHDRPPASSSDPGTYNQFWWDEGGPLKQTSLIVDPPDGRIPALTPDGERRRAVRRARRLDRADAPEDRNLSERCITRGAPKLPGGYNNNFQIVQTPQHVAILQEMIHETRIVPMDGRPHAPAQIRSFLGDSRGRWEGDTLVVDTTNFNDKVGTTSYNCCGGAAEHLHIIERFTRIDENTIDYQYTVDDPTTFTRSWTVKLPMRRIGGPLYEYACHEGNYSMAGMLKGRRAEEKAVEEQAPKDGRK